MCVEVLRAMLMMVLRPYLPQLDKCVCAYAVMSHVCQLVFVAQPRTGSQQPRMSYRADSEEFEEEEEEEEEENAKGLIVSREEGYKRQGRMGSSEDCVSRGSRRSSGSLDDGELSNSVQEDNGREKNNDGDQNTPVRRSSNSDDVGVKDCLSPPRQVSSGEFESDLDYNEEEEDQRRDRTIEKRGKQVCVCTYVRICVW